MSTILSTGTSGAPAFMGATYGGGGVNVDIDATFVVQMFIFAALVVILKPLLFDPVLKIFEEREARTDGARAQARDMQERAGELLRRYEAELLRVNQVAAQERDRIRTETAKLEGEIMNEAREAAASILAQGRADVSEQLQKIRFDVGRQSEQLAREIAARTLGRGVN